MVSHDFRQVSPPHASIGHWLATKLEQLEKKQQLHKEAPVTLDPSIVGLQQLVAASPNLMKLSREMFTQIPPAYKDDPTGKPQFATDVKLHDTFWLKEQPYSLAEMLDNQPETEQFVGGSVYQAFLSALSYHCWHAPVSGKVVDIRHVAGSYYSENLSQGFDNPEAPDAAAPNNSQPYISAVAARGIIFIQADNPLVGLMAIVFIGMAEVSSREFTVKVGERIDKGQSIGMFRFGGSTHCLVFRPETGLSSHKLVDPPPWKPDASINLPVCGALAVVTPPLAGS